MATMPKMELLRGGVEVMKLEGALTAGITAEHTFPTGFFNQDLLHPPPPPSGCFRPAFHAAI